jgi:hypothetical protein
MYRQVIREQVIYGHFMDYFAVAQEMIAYGNSKGWAPITIYGPLTGSNNDVVYHADYASLADLENEMKEVMTDATFMAIFRRQAGHVVQGSSVSEILMTLDDVV